MNRVPQLGVGLGWRHEISPFYERCPELGFVEAIAEGLERTVPRRLEQLREKGMTVIPHGVSLSLGSAEHPDASRLRRLADVVGKLRAPLVSEHLCFVRAGGLESGHLIPVPRTREMLDIVVENIREAEAALPVPLALENIAALFDWPESEMDEATFLAEVLDRTGALLLLDVANLYANAQNLHVDPIAFLDRLPLERLAYVHVAGGVRRGALYHDTHAHAIPPDVYALVTEVARRCRLAERAARARRQFSHGVSSRIRDRPGPDGHRPRDAGEKARRRCRLALPLERRWASAWRS